MKNLKAASAYSCGARASTAPSSAVMPVYGERLTRPQRYGMGAAGVTADAAGEGEAVGCADWVWLALAMPGGIAGVAGSAGTDGRFSCSGSTRTARAAWGHTGCTC